MLISMLGCRPAASIRHRDPIIATHFVHTIGLLCCSALALSIHAADRARPVDLTLRNLEGGRVHLHDYRGKLVLLNFWATWCGPCNEEMPLLVKIEKEYSAKGTVFIGASLDEAHREKIAESAKRYNVPYPIWMGATADDLERFHLGQTVPATVFLSQDGAVLFRVSGEIRESELRERLDWLLSDRSSPAPASFLDHSR